MTQILCACAEGSAVLLGNVTAGVTSSGGNAPHRAEFKILLKQTVEHAGCVKPAHTAALKDKPFVDKHN